ncbi:hypothetical protein [Nocardioides sp.]|uniref:AMIN-like domain-containing (lipo)protein n=1 Tax=Nocardioides sp. TaxID=35761 RepID=UPI002634C6D6|nr:hypothetical protein [Nocardioides sp.]MCW2737310.1 hypothetical protein [Nocardioides sp.]
MRILRKLSSTSLLVALLVAAPQSGGAPPPAAPQALPQLVDVRAVHRAGFDRVIFQFDSGIPSGADVRYVRRLRGDGSGLPIRIAGRAILQVGLHDTRTDTASPAPARRAFALPNVMTAVRSGLFEGWTTYGIGLARRTPVEVIRQPGRSRVVIAVDADFPTVDRQVFFLDEDRFAANQEPFFVARTRPVPLGSPATGVMDRLFAGPLDRERSRGLRLVRSGATGFADLAVSGGIARVRLLGRCSSGGSTVTIAGEIAPTLRQFDTVDWVKVLDRSGATADPTGPTDSIPDCLNP